MSPSWFAGWGGFIGDTALGVKDAAFARGARIATSFASDMAKQTREAAAYKPKGKPLPRPGQGRGGYVADRSYPRIGSSPPPADTSAYWAWPKRDAWPKFSLGY